MGKNTEKKREGLGVWNKRWKGSEGKDEVGKYKAKKREEERVIKDEREVKEERETVIRDEKEVKERIRFGRKEIKRRTEIVIKRWEGSERRVIVRKTREKNRNWDSERNAKVRKNKEKKREVKNDKRVVKEIFMGVNMEKL